MKPPGGPLNSVRGSRCARERAVVTHSVHARCGSGGPRPTMSDAASTATAVTKWIPAMNSGRLGGCNLWLVTASAPHVLLRLTSSSPDIR